MPRDEILSLAEEDGAIAADCQFGGRLYRFPAKDI
jgi:redox-regulated HSP33 family molecular chaperone